MTPAEQIECSILGYMIEDTPSYYRYGWFMPIRYITKALTIDFPMTRGFLHSMRMRGFVEFGRGFNEDGMVAGSGYTVTPQGEAHCRSLKEKLRNEQIAARESCLNADRPWGTEYR